MAEAETAAPAEQATTAATETATETTETKAGVTLAETGGTTETETAIQATWPDDWRNRMAGKDEATLKRLGRFTSPENVFKSFLQLEKKLSSGEGKPAGLPEKATPEQITEYRKANGIPEKADDYFSNLDGIVIGENDKPALTAFAERMHGLNAPPSVVKEATKWYYETVEQQQAIQAEKDAEFRAEADQSLRQEWGGQYKGNLSAMHGLLDSGPKGVKELIFNSRLADGTPMGDHPDILRLFVGLAHEINPAGTVVPNATAASGAKSVAEEITALQVQMKDRRTWHSEANKPTRDRYRQLLEVQQKMAGKAA